jgi:hypothetical protein
MDSRPSGYGLHHRVYFGGVMNTSNLSPQGTLPAKKSKSYWWIAALIVFLLVRGIDSYQSPRTPKDLVREASGQQPIPSNASDKEKQAVALIAQILEINKENTASNDAFEQTFTGRNLLKPETLSSPDVAARSLIEVENYCRTQKAYIRQIQQLLTQAEQIDGGTTDLSWMNNQYNAALAFCSATENLYQYASDPVRKIRIINGKVFITGAEGYNERIKAVNDAAKKLLATTRAFEEEQNKGRQKDNITPQDYDVR